MKSQANEPSHYKDEDISRPLIVILLIGFVFVFIIGYAQYGISQGSTPSQKGTSTETSEQSDQGIRKIAASTLAIPTKVTATTGANCQTGRVNLSLVLPTGSTDFRVYRNGTYCAQLGYGYSKQSDGSNHLYDNGTWSRCNALISGTIYKYSFSALYDSVESNKTATVNGSSCGSGVVSPTVTPTSIQFTPTPSPQVKTTPETTVTGTDWLKENF